MVTSLRQFNVDLYEEHLDEAGFLWEQVRAVRRQLDLSWVDAGPFEERLEAHLDALLVGGDTALEVCRRRATEGEPGELFAALCVVCRHGDTVTFASLLRSVDYTQPERTQAVTDALKWELPDAWREHCIRAVGQGQSPLVSLLATVIGYRRLPQSGVIVDVALGLTRTPQGQVLWAIGRTRPPDAARVIRPALRSEDPLVRGAAFRAGLRMHDREVMAELFSRPDGPQTLPVEIGLCGGRAAVAALVAAARQPGASPEVIAALGLLGDLSAVRPLVELLSVETLAQSAGEALHVITGAVLVTDVQVPDVMSEDEMHEQELAAFRETGARPGRGDGQPYATIVRQLSVDPVAWEAWLSANASRFKPDRRYRLGREYSPRVLLDCLVSDTFPKTWRGLVADELLVRYGIDVPFEPDLPILAQQRVLSESAAAVQAGESIVESGRWYSFGSL
jgi:uncharacterized protein (TIGR02270 family)